MEQYNERKQIFIMIPSLPNYCHNIMEKLEAIEWPTKQNL